MPTHHTAPARRPAGYRARRPGRQRAAAGVRGMSLGDDTAPATCADAQGRRTTSPGRTGPPDPDPPARGRRAATVRRRTPAGPAPARPGHGGRHRRAAHRRLAFANRGGDGDRPRRSRRLAARRHGPQARAARPPTRDEAGRRARRRGIPSGFAQTEQGAQSAAANYAVALGGGGHVQRGPPARDRADVYDPLVASRAAGASWTRRTPTSFLDKLSASTPDGNAPSGLTFVSRTVPVGTKVTGFAATRRHDVEVWCTGLCRHWPAQGSTNPVTTAWFTIDREASVDGRRLEGRSRPPRRTGPAPVSGDDQASTADEIARRSRSTEASPMPGSPPTPTAARPCAAGAVRSPCPAGRARRAAAPTPTPSPPTPGQRPCDRASSAPAKDYCQSDGGATRARPRHPPHRHPSTPSPPSPRAAPTPPPGSSTSSPRP